MERRTTTIDIEQLQEMLNTAAEMGAKEALRSIGLSDIDAGSDIKDLREMLKNFKSCKSEFFKAIVKRTGDIIVILVIIGLGLSSKDFLKALFQ